MKCGGGNTGSSSMTSGNININTSGFRRGPHGDNSERNLAWSWVEKLDSPCQISEEEINLSFRLHFALHDPFNNEAKCKRNCRGNPKCYVGLGEAPWIANTSSDDEDEDEDEDDEDDEDLALERRHPAVPSGLKNLGNTCYVNSFLQIWFHNIKFRQALYKWNYLEDPEEDEEIPLKGKVGALQSLFAMLEFTNRRAVDPNDFITKLGLDPQVQQDAQEFSKLFISLLESSLSHQKDDTVRTIVQSQFRGEYYYVTKCLKCKRESKRPSYFYELDLTLQGHKTLQDCLQDFTKDEKLDGDNQYFCEGCNAKHDATRNVRLATLPPVLNLQLNRFIFDMQTGRKKKLNSFVQFPEKLDMSEYLGKEKGSDVYSLTGVLMHVGAEANHGHYIAHIQEAATGQWFKFSDVFVERLDVAGAKHRLGVENDPLISYVGGKNNAKNAKIMKGHQGSNNAYMLVYTESSAVDAIRNTEIQEKKKKDHVKNLGIRNAKINFRKQQRLERELRKEYEDEEDEDDDDEEEDEEEDSESDDSDIEPNEIAEREYNYVNGLVYPSSYPDYLRTYIEEDRRLFEEEFHEAMMTRREKSSERRGLKQRVRDIIARMPYREENDLTGTDFEFIPTEWLSRYFERPSAASMIETINYLCIHGKLDVEKLTEVKVVDSEVAEELYEEAGDASARRLTHDSLCTSCVKNKFRQIKLVQTSTVDAKCIMDWLRTSVHKESNENLYWVGKLSLKRWRQIAKQNLDDRIQEEIEAYQEEMEAMMEMSSDEEEDEFLEDEEEEFALKNGNGNKEEKSLSEEEDKVLSVEDVQNRLIKIGTNVTVAKVNQKNGNNGNSSSPKRVSPESSSSNGTNSKISNGTNCKISSGTNCNDSNSDNNTVEKSSKSGITVIHNGTSQTFESIAKIKENNANTTDDDDEEESRHNGNNGIKCGNNGKSNNNGHYRHSSRHLGGKHLNSKAGSSSRLDFNEDIVCIHGNLCVEEGRRKLVQEKVWNKLRAYFPHCRVFPYDKTVESCQECTDELNQAAKEHERKREIAQLQKSIFSDLLNDRNRPTWSKPSLNLVYLISRSFVREWRTFVRNTNSCERIRDICNATLLCQHGGLIYPLDLDTESDYESVVFMVWEEEWQNIKKHFNVDHEVSVTRNRESSSELVLRSDPRVCGECVKRRFEQEEQDKLVYKNVVVFVRRLAGGEKFPETDVRGDPDFNSENESHKKLKLNNGNSVVINGNVRRSNRRQKVRGEREFNVSSDMLLRDFKVKVMEAFKVPPFDQNLCLNGLYLTESSQTLGELRVLPRSLIYLRADEPSGSTAIEPDEGWAAHQTEEGFKGTGLLSGF